MQFSVEEIIVKVDSGVDLSVEEEVFYLLEVLKIVKNEDEALQLVGGAKKDDC